MIQHLVNLTFLMSIKQHSKWGCAVAITILSQNTLVPSTRAYKRYPWLMEPYYIELLTDVLQCYRDDAIGAEHHKLHDMANTK